ncbi:hypothetical protein [Arthrobacter sp. H14]|uniref:hypothetical protein n=1 Tax=Arthrobacter sp. H14 TaxID=1312959 RepID=UPI0004B0F72C|nr:hypothetical protein [Arthrobacter sp. H14]
MKTPPSDTGPVTAAALYETGGSDPDFYFPAPVLSTRGSCLARICSLPSRFFKFFRR